MRVTKRISKCWRGPEINPSVWMPPSTTHALLPQEKFFHGLHNGIFLILLVGSHQPADLCEAPKYFCGRPENEDSETESVTC